MSKQTHFKGMVQTYIVICKYTIYMGRTTSFFIAVKSIYHRNLVHLIKVGIYVYVHVYHSNLLWAIEVLEYEQCWG